MLLTWLFTLGTTYQWLIYDKPYQGKCIWQDNETVLVSGHFPSIISKFHTKNVSLQQDHEIHRNPINQQEILYTHEKASLKV